MADQKRTVFSPSHKLQVLQVWDEGGDISETIRHFYPGLTIIQCEARRKFLYAWQKQRGGIEILARRPLTAKRKKNRPLGVGTALSVASEKEIVKWVNDLRGEGVPISSLMLRIHATRVARNSEVTSFRASTSWVRRFYKRHKLSMRAKTRQGQVRPEDADEAAKIFGAKVLSKMDELGVTRVFNADQTVFFEYLPKTTIDHVGRKTVWVRWGGGSKMRAMVMLLADSHGIKYSPTVVLKSNPSTVAHVATANLNSRHGFGARVWETVKKIQKKTGMKVYGDRTGWWNDKLHCRFLKRHFGERPNKAFPVLLLVDEFSGYWTDFVRQYADEINVHLMAVPAGLTSVCQPADVAWMRPFKDQLRGSWVQFLTDQLDRRVPGTPFKLKAPNVGQVCDWVTTAWGAVGFRSIRAGFSRTHMQKTADEVAEKLRNLGLLDGTVGEVTSEDEFDA